MDCTLPPGGAVHAIYIWQTILHLLNSKMNQVNNKRVRSSKFQSKLMPTFGPYPAANLTQYYKTATPVPTEVALAMTEIFASMPKNVQRLIWSHVEDYYFLELVHKPHMKVVLRQAMKLVITRWGIS